MYNSIKHHMFHGKYSLHIGLTAMVLLAMACVLQSYHLWRAIVTPEFKPITPNPKTQNIVRQKDSAVDITRFHLFGEYIPKDLAHGDVPKTLLDVKLHGILVAKPSKYSQAILAISGGEEKIYQLGDRIPGGAKIVRILKNGIIFKHNGKLEGLYLPHDKLIFQKNTKPLDFKYD